VGAASGVGVGEATGVTTNLIGSAVPAPPHAATMRGSASNSHPARKSRLIFPEKSCVERGKGVPTYGFLDVIPVSGMVGIRGSWPCAWPCVPVPASAPVEGAPGEGDCAAGWPEPGR
jgi:hypothetical protein